jgi:hypothetical protein
MNRAEELLQLAEKYDREGRAYVAAKLRVAAQEMQQDEDKEGEVSDEVTGCAVPLR